MNENKDPLANFFNSRSPKDVDDFRNILEEAIEVTGANKNLPEIGNFFTEVEAKGLFLYLFTFMVGGGFLEVQKPIEKFVIDSQRQVTWFSMLIMP